MVGSSTIRFLHRKGVAVDGPDTTLLSMRQTDITETMTDQADTNAQSGRARPGLRKRGAAPYA